MKKLQFQACDSGDIHKLKLFMNELDEFHFVNSNEFININKDYDDSYFLGDNTETFIIWNDCSIIGFYRLKIFFNSLVYNESYVVLDPLFIKKDYRNKGIGLQVMDEIEKYVASIKINSILLNVWSFNDVALKLYSRLGYKNIKFLMKKDIV